MAEHFLSLRESEMITYFIVSLLGFIHRSSPGRNEFFFDNFDFLKLSFKYFYFFEPLVFMTYFLQSFFIIM